MNPNHPRSRASRLAVWPARLGTLALLLLALTLRAGETPSRPELALGRTEQYDYDPPEPGTYELPVLMEAGNGLVLQSDGDPEPLRDLMKGRITVLSFIYTRCPDPTACPMATGALRQIHAITREDPALARNLLLLSMSFDPAFDTPRLMNAFAKANRREREGAPWKFLTAPSQRALKPILEAYGQVIHRKEKDPSQRIFHPVRVYLIDAKGKVRNIYSIGLLDPRMVLTDIRTLLLEAGDDLPPATP